jgi:hypothetical protein
MVFQQVNHPWTSIVVAVNWMVISGLPVFGVNVEDSNSIARAAILGRIKPVASILPEKGITCFNSPYSTSI